MSRPTGARSLRIVVPLTGFGRPGGNRVLSRLADEWIAAGHDVSFVVNARSTPPYFPTRARVHWVDDAGRAAAGTRSPDAPLGVTPFHPANIACLRPALDRIAADADVVLANQSRTAWPVFLARTPARKAYYVQAYEPELVHGSGPRAAAKRVALAATYLLPLRRVVNSPLYRRYGVLRARHVVPPGVDFALFRPDPGRAVLQDRPVRLGCIGRDEVWKGTGLVLEAYRRLRAAGAPVELWVAYGGVPDALRGLPGLRVVVPENDAALAAFYRSLDVVLAPGLIQLGAPHYPVMEAMACGIPVVTTGYMPASRENSWIVPVGDVDAIVAAVSQILADPAEARRRAGLALQAMQPFAWPVVASALLGHVAPDAAPTDGRWTR